MGNEDLKFDRNRDKVKTCPCGKSNSDGKFSPFKGYVNRGKCFSCDRVFWPESDTPNRQTVSRLVNPCKPTTFLNFQTVRDSTQRYNENSLAQAITKLVGQPAAYEVFDKYYLGTSPKWKDSAVFWQIDASGQIRTGKIMAYDKLGHRVKQPRSRISWIHVELGLTDYNLQQCFYGEHLLSLDKSKPIAIVESEKTALICAIYFPSYIWLATGGKCGCNFSSEKVNHVLKCRNVTLFPDVGAYNLWLEKSTAIPSRRVRVSGYLEKIAVNHPEMQGDDLADYLLHYPTSAFPSRVWKV